MRTSSSILSAAYLLVAAPALLAQTDAPPGDVGRPVRVDVYGGPMVTGTLAEPLGDTTVVVESSGNRTALHWRGIATLEVLRPRSSAAGVRARAATGILGGAAAGTMAGFVASVTWQGPRGEERSRSGMMTGGALIGGGLGALVGGLIGYHHPGESWRTVRQPPAATVAVGPGVEGGVSVGFSLTF